MVLGAFKESKENKVLMDREANQVIEAKMAHLEKKVIREHLDLSDKMATMAVMEKKEKTDGQGILAPKVLQENREYLMKR